MAFTIAGNIEATSSFIFPSKNGYFSINSFFIILLHGEAANPLLTKLNLVTSPKHALDNIGALELFS